MPEMGRYCKAYLVSNLRKFSGWKEDLGQIRKETNIEDGKEVEIPRDQLLDDDVLFLHESLIVTDGIFQDQNIIFKDVSDAWRDFCNQELKFQIPEDVLAADQQVSESTTEDPALRIPRDVKGFRGRGSKS